MKKIIMAFVLAISQIFFLFNAGLGAKGESTSVIVELELPHGDDPFEYAARCAKYVDGKISDFEIEYVYSTLLCGFSGRVPVSALSILREYDFVKNVYDSAQYNSLEYAEDIYSDDGVYDMISAEMAGLGNDSEDGLTGDGVIVAVIDNGFDLNHNAFSVEVTEALDRVRLATSVGKRRPHAFMSVTSPESLCHSSKIPFAFDYAGRDMDVSGNSAHGTHVAGIIGAAATDNRNMQGIAPNCQLVLMKIFDEGTGTATDTAMIAALEDALRIGVDVINLSLGSYAGSTSANIVNIDSILEKARDNGCVIICAAGNEGVASSQIGKIPAGYTDYGTISFPSTTEYAISVGSVDNLVSFGQYFRHGRNSSLTVSYNDRTIIKDSEEISFTECFDGRTVSYEIVPGAGSKGDYESINVFGKIALIERGEISFVEKINNAAEKGAVGAIIYGNTEEDMVNMDLNGAEIPAVYISRGDGLALKKEANHRLEFNKDFTVRKHESGGLVSSFSSFGVTPSLTLKPDICGVGGSILSTAPNNTYVSMSGTSMASPQVAGIAALMVEKLKAEGKKGEELSNEIRTALMNTAKPVFQSNGVEYSPRVQGAGLVNFAAAANRRLKVTSTATDYPKVELYDGISDEFSFSVTVENVTDEPISFKLDMTIATAGYKEAMADGDKKYYNTLRDEADKYSDITILGGGNLNRYATNFIPDEITLMAGEAKEISVSVKLDKSYHHKLSNVFKNGYFIEGYLTCRVSPNEAVSIPYLGYVGDWSRGSIIDADIYSGEDTILGGSGFYVMVSDEGYTPAGINSFDGDLSYDGEVISFSPNADGTADILCFFAPALRNAKTAVMTISNGEGEIVMSSVSEYITKDIEASDIRLFRFSWDGGDGIFEGYVFPDGEYTVEFAYFLDYKDLDPHRYTYTIVVDTVKPRAGSISLDKDKLTIVGEDENEIFSIGIYENDKEGAYFKYVASDMAEFDISDFTGDSLYYEIIDSGYNILVCKIDIAEMRGAK